MTYYDDHREERIEYQRQYNTLNRDKYLEYQRQYNQTVLWARRRIERAAKRVKPPILKAFPVAQSILYEKRINKKQITIPSPELSDFHISFT